MDPLPEDDAGHRWQSTRLALHDLNAQLRHPINGQGGQAPGPDDSDDDQPPTAA